MVSRFGKAPVKGDYRIPRFEHYLLSGIYQPPTCFSLLESCRDLLRAETVQELFPMYGNDLLPNSSVVAVAHSITAASLRGARPCVIPESEVLKLYRAQSPGENSSLALTDVLSSAKLGIGKGATLLAVVSVDARDLRQIRLAMEIFGGLCCGFQVMAGCAEAADRGMPWTPGLLTEFGHAACSLGYDEGGIQLVSWGRLQLGTWDWWRQCVDEVYGLITSQSIRRGLPGLDVGQLETDFGLRLSPPVDCPSELEEFPVYAKE